MRRTIAFLTLFVLIPFVAEAQEQEEELPRGLFVSQWQCPQNQIQWISQMYDMFFHDWGDEWNVNWYRIGQDRSAVFDAVSEVGRRMNERHPDAPNLFESCRAHRDNIYFWGPRTAPPSQ
jgi:hypothetical protein